MSNLGYILALTGFLQILSALNVNSTENVFCHTTTSQMADTKYTRSLGYAALTENDTIINDTIILNDTIINDTVSINDTITLNDTISLNDTIQLNDTLSTPIPAEEEEPEPSNWDQGIRLSFTLSQISLSNWSGGGQSSASFSSYANAFMNYKTPDDRITWENSLDVDYGLINQEHRRTVKSDDKIDFSTQFGRMASERWSYSSLLSFRTQMAPGYKSPGDTVKISNFMAPAYLNISLGMDHKFDENITFYLSPLAGRVTYVLDEELSEEGSFGVEKGETRRNEFGGFIRARFRATLIENIEVNSRLELFSNYLDKPQNLNIDMTTRITMEITRFITANLLIQMKYDDDHKIRIDEDTVIGPRLQLKQVFGLGLSFRI